MSHQNKTGFTILTLFLLPFLSFAQVSTITFTSTNPADGQGGLGGTNCGANGYIGVPSGYCGLTATPAITANMSGAQLYFLGVAGGSGRTMSNAYAGGTMLTYSSDWSTPSASMTGFLARSFGNATNPIDLTSVTIYHEAGTDVDFTIQGATSYGGTDLGRTIETIPTGVATAVSLSGNYGFREVSITPASTVNFGVTNFVISDSPLPVEWGGFSAESNETSVNLAWTTLQEMNTHYFEVQRSQGGEEYFETIGKVDAAGFSDEASQYSFVDYHPSFLTQYYRIKQVDLDGNSSFSQVEEIQTALSISVTPNPVNGLLRINTPDPSWNGQLINLQGKTIRDLPPAKRIIDLTDLPAGLYLLKLTNDSNQTYTEKILKY